jgi:hypothetical protein
VRRFRTWLAVLTTFVLGTAMVPSAAQAVAPEPFGCQMTAIKQVDTNTYVTVDINNTGNHWAQLVARATTIGPKELFEVCKVDAGGGSSYWTIRAEVNNMYVSADWGYTGADAGLLRARSAVVGPWEQFTLPSWSQPGSFYAITYPLQWVMDTAPANVYGVMRARSAFRSPPRTMQLITGLCARGVNCNGRDPVQMGCTADAVELATVGAADGSTTMLRVLASPLCQTLWAQAYASPIDPTPPAGFYAIDVYMAPTSTAAATGWGSSGCCSSGYQQNTFMTAYVPWYWACIRPFRNPGPTACTARVHYA